MKQVVLLFGTFNPVHNGHLQIAESVLANTKKLIDEVWIIPSPLNPHKEGITILSFKERVEMLCIAIKNERIIVCEIERELPIPSYTCNTLKALTILYPELNFHIIIGSDNFHSLKTWREYEETISKYSFFVVNRGEDISHIEDEKFTVIDINAAISSTEIRMNIKDSISIEEKLPACVYQYIKDKKLFLI